MYIVIPAEGRARMVIRSSALTASRATETSYNLRGDTCQMMDVTDEQVLLFPDGAEVAEGQPLTEELLTQALPMEQFISLTPEEALPNALSMLLRIAVAEGKITDEELLPLKPMLARREWHAGMDVKDGDVVCRDGALWRCVQAHRTRMEWLPASEPSLWRRIEAASPDAPRVWSFGVLYAEGDVVAYPDAEGARYRCRRKHLALPTLTPEKSASLWAGVET